MTFSEYRLTSTQKGAVTEHLVASVLTLASDGRLSPFMPMSDDDGVDLLVLDKVTNAVLAIQVKSAIANASRKTVQFDVRKATLGVHANRYLLAVLFDPDSVAIALSWLIPMSDVPTVSVAQATKFALSPSTAATTADRYQPDRNATPHALAEAVLQVMTDCANPHEAVGTSRF